MVMHWEPIVKEFGVSMLLSYGGVFQGGSQCVPIDGFDGGQLFLVLLDFLELLVVHVSVLIKVLLVHLA